MKLSLVRGMTLMLLLAASSPTVVAAQAPPPVADGAIEALPPGGFLWAPDIAPQGPVTIIVSLKTQRAYAYRNGVPIGVSTVSTGTRGHETPTGVFVILQKAVVHHSNKYSNAPMPFMERLTWDGVAMHAGNLPGYPASHGCIRLPPAFAKLLYGVTRLGLTVVITDDALAPEVVPTPGVLKAAVVEGRQGDESYRWAPARAPHGPVSIVISARDRRLVVLRNGVIIGSGSIMIDGPVPATQAFTLSAVDSGGAHWLRLPLPGQPLAVRAEMEPGDHARGHIAEALRKHILDVLAPGVTLLITRDSIRSAGTGTRITVIKAADK